MKLHYDETSPTFLRWNQDAYHQVAGKPAGSVSKVGYAYIRKGKQALGIHNIVWEIHNGPIPAGLLIDHIDRNPSNNNINNLRLSTPSQNSCNTGRSKTNSSGHKGVTWNNRNQAYSVRVTKEGKVHFGGWHKDLESALYKAQEMRRELHGEFARD